MAFGDCAVIPEPTTVQLAEIAISTAGTFETLTGMAPIVALLSFSTKGSSTHSRATLVVEATRIAGERAPRLRLDGELQIDAALDPSVGMYKARDSPVAGHANVMIFPNLDAGNIAYKVAQRLGGAIALGPFLQGVNGSMSDLSRGCSSSDVRITATACAVLSQRTADKDVT
jgi:phosphotransacetylase